MNERQQQMEEQKMMKAQEKEAERLMAMQAEHLRRQQIIADRQHKRQLREMQAGARATQEQQKQEHQIAYADPYNEKGPGFSSH